MEFKTKFEIGQEVFILGHSEAYRIRACDTCSQSGKVIINGAEFICPNCLGRSAHRQYAGRAWYVAYHKSKIGKIGVESNIAEEWRRSSHGYRPDCAYSEFDTKITYMADQSGIGSGSVFSEENVFATFEEAEAECVRRNAGNLKDHEGAVVKAEVR